MISPPGYIRLRHIPMHKPQYGIGLMSGTSVDAVDAAWVRIDTREAHPLHVESFIEHPIPQALRTRIFDAMQPSRSRVDILCQLNLEIGELFADAANHLISSSSIKKEQIHFIGSHGQTLYHIPAVNPSRGWATPSTLQLGDPCVIAERTGIQTIGDFRIRDMAAGGTGAPLIPFLDAFLFADRGEDVLCQNIGGIANCTLIPKKGAIVAFDSGPGNMVMDALIQHDNPDQRYDPNGTLARKGTVDQEVLFKLLQHPYFKTPPPKATGHEDFGHECVQQILELKAWRPADALATACEWTACTIVNAYRDFILPQARPNEVILSGGGSKNAFLLQRLQALSPDLRWRLIDDFGIPADAKEAAGFALLAFAALHRIPANIPSVTGARKEVILGKIAG